MALNLTSNWAGIGLYRETVTGIISAVAVAAGVATAAATGVGITAAVGSSSGSAACSGVSSGTIGTGAGSSTGLATIAGRSQNDFTRLNIGIWPDFSFTSQLTRSWTVATTIQLGADVGAFGDVEIQIDLEVRPLLSSTSTKVLNAVTGTSAGTSIVRGYSGSQASAAGVATVAGVGATAGTVFGNAPGVSAGSSTASAVGALASIGVGSSSGTSSAAATGFQQASTGFAAGTSTATAVTSNSIVTGVGSAHGTCSVVGIQNLAIPDVIGFLLESAVLALEGRHLVVNIVYQYNAATAGTVFLQLPPGGVDAFDGSIVTIFVSRGPYIDRSDYGLIPDAYGPVSYTKTPDEEIDIPFAWATRLNGETITTDSFELPDGLTSVLESGTQSLRTIRISAGIDGTTYRVIGKVTTSAGRELEWVQRVLVREG